MIVLPVRSKGRQTSYAQLGYQSDLRRFAGEIEQIASGLEFTVSSRGWCYILEEHGIKKGQFDQVQKIINECRKNGMLPVDICANDEAREADVPGDYADVLPLNDHAQSVFDDIAYVYEHALEDAQDRLEDATYEPNAFWDYQRCYLEMAVEKIDLRTLFKPTCDRYKIPLTNIKGWADLNSRAAMMRRFEVHAAAGRQCVLLYAGDHDPSGLRISDAIRSNLFDVQDARYRNGDRICFYANDLVIDRFGLNADFIERHGLSWIEGLQTGSGRDLASDTHCDHNKSYVQNYLSRFGARKVEANALVTRPQAARDLCESAILRYIDLDAERQRRDDNAAATYQFRQRLTGMAQGSGLL